MSERNGDKARFQKNRKRKLRHRQRIRALMAGVRTKSDEDASNAAARSVTATSTDAASRAASLAMQDEGGPTRAGD
jgi:hypothetical protein